jgi:hypothetical protein
MRLHRRAFLATAGTAALAGCPGTNSSGDEEPSSDTGDDERVASTPVRTAGDADGGPGTPPEVGERQQIEQLRESRFAPALTAETRHLPVDRQRLADSTVSGGVDRDGIPPIDRPFFVEPERATDLLDDGDVVFGLVHESGPRAYPRRILVYHEVCNDVTDGRVVTVTYCPLTGTALAFEGGGTTFGVSGRLLNSNLVMYDRWSETLWPQIHGTAIPGPWNRSPEAVSIQEVPLVWTTWKRWRTVYPDTDVLWRETNYVRPYRRDRDPYGSYNPRSGYYTRDSVGFPPMFESDRYHPKRVVVGARTTDGAAAFRKDALREKGTLDGTVGGESVVAVYDARLDTAYVYHNPETRRVGVDGERATVDGETHDPDDLPLDRVTSFDAMWFAWYAFYPDTNVYE